MCSTHVDDIPRFLCSTQPTTVIANLGALASLETLSPQRDGDTEKSNIALILDVSNLICYIRDA